MTPVFLTPKQLAERWNFCQRTIKRMAQRGDIPHTRLGNRFRFLRAEIERYEKQHSASLHAVQRRQAVTAGQVEVDFGGLD